MQNLNIKFIFYNSTYDMDPHGVDFLYFQKIPWTFRPTEIYPGPK